MCKEENNDKRWYETQEIWVSVAIKCCFLIWCSNVSSKNGITYKCIKMYQKDKTLRSIFGLDFQFITSLQFNLFSPEPFVVAQRNKWRKTSTYFEPAFPSDGHLEPSSGLASIDASCETGADGVGCVIGNGAAIASEITFDFCALDLSLGPDPLLALTVKFRHLSYWCQSYQRKYKP